MFLNKIPKRLIQAACALPLALGTLFLIRMPLNWMDQSVFSGLIILTCIVAGRLSASRVVTSTLTLVSIFCSLRYIVWRWSASVSFLNHSGWNVDLLGLIFALALLAAESYSVLILLLGYFQSARSLRRKPVPMTSDLTEWPTVDVYIPTYNESLDVVRPTVLAAMGIDWPQDRIKIYILDDGRRPEFREFAAECGCEYLVRSDNKHAKAGNINAALKMTSGEYIAIFDCDHIATRSFLQLTMGWFGKDPKLALVQTPHHFYSPDPFERNLNLFRRIPNEGALFYGVVQDGNDLWNATFFCGSCAVIKREALAQIGGIAVETVTEDAHTALRLQRLGWNTAYIGIPQAAGLATGSLAAHVGQRIRWARGMVQILRTEFPPFASGLTFAQRICYLNCAMHYLYAIPRLTFVSAPLVYLVFGKSNLYGFIWEIMAYAVPHLVLSNMVNSRTQGDHRHSFWNEVYEMVLAPYILLPTTFALINPKWGKFNVTAKSSVVEENFFDWQIARPYIYLLALNVVGMACAIPRYFTSGDSSGVLLINVLWAALNSLMIGACIAVSFESKQRRSTARVEAPLSASIILGDQPEQHCHVIDLSEGGLALRSDSNFAVQNGTLGLVVIRAGTEQFRFEIESVRSHENRVHLRFIRNDLRHQREITKLVYARADSWINWNKDQRRDRILSSLLHVFSIGANGIWMLPSLLIRREKKATQQQSGERHRLTLPNSALPMVALVCGLVLASSLKAQTAFHDSQTLAELGARSAVLLNHDHPANTLNFVLPSSKIVDSAELTLSLHSGDLPADNDLEMHVTLNGVEAASLPAINWNGGSEPVVLSLPADLLVRDNTLQFELKHQRKRVDTRQASIAGWIRIEPASELRTSGLMLNLPNRLSMLPAPFFDASLQRAIEVPIVLEAQPSLDALRASGTVASWLGSLAAHRGTHFAVSAGKFPKGNAILIAASGSNLAAELHLSNDATQVAVLDNPADPYGKVLALVSPRSSILPELAALLVHNRLREEVDHVVIDETALLAHGISSEVKGNWDDPKYPIALTKGVTDGMLQARFGETGKLYFRLPPDLEYGTKLTVPLTLGLRLGGLTADDHLWLSIRLNNTFVTKRRLGVADSGKALREMFAIPVSLLYSSNTLELELNSDRSETSVLNPQAVTLQILRNSQIDLGNPVHFVEMPRLDLFAESGYPFTSKPDLSETTIVLPGFPTAAQIGLYLDAMAFLSAQTGIPSERFRLVNGKDLQPGANADLLVIAGTNDDESFRPFQRQMTMLPVNGRFEANNIGLPWQEWLSRAMLARREESSRLNQLLERESSLAFLMEQFANPYRRERSVLVLASRSETDSNPYFEMLAKASREGAISGGLVLADSEHFQSFALSWRHYSLGSHVSIAAVYSALRFHLWILPMLLLGGAFLMARWWEGVLERQAERRLQPGL